MSTRSAFQTALDFAQRGFYVFPVQPGTKKPFRGFPWRERSTNDREVIRKAANHSQYSGCGWAVDCGKSGLVILDIDDKPRKRGFETLKTMPPTESALMVETPSGGRHIYFTGKVANSVSKLGPGLDTRGEGGYALIPGSDVGGKPYRFLSDGVPSPVPGWISSGVGAPVERKPDRDIPIVDPDKPENIAREINYLTYDAPEAIEGDGGDQTTYNIACHLRDNGISEEKAFELMAEHWNAEKARPPWSANDLQKKIRNAYQYAKDRPGNATSEAQFTEREKSTSAIRCAADVSMSSLKPRRWLLGYRYIPEYITLTLAPGGVGKSLLTLHEGLSIASGKQLTHEEPRETGAVWLYNTEDPFDELDRRVMSAARLHNLTSTDLADFYYSSGYDNPMKIAKLDDKGRPIVNENIVQSIIGHIKKRNVKLFIVDPFVECHDLPENDNMAIAKVAQAFRRIAKETGCAISLVHHTSKGKAEHGQMDKARGASSLVSAARIAHTLYPMGEKEAKTYGLQPMDAAWYVRLDDAKANLSPPNKRARWYRKESVKLFFDDPETTGALKAVSLSEAGEEPEENVIIDRLAVLIDVGKSISLYRAAKLIDDMQVLDAGVKAIQQKISLILTEPQATAMGVLRLTTVSGGRGGDTVGVEHVR